MAKRPPQNKRKPGQRKPIVYKTQAWSLHTRHYGFKLNEWLKTSNFAPSELKKLRPILQTYFRPTQTGQLITRSKNFSYDPYYFQPYLGKDIDHIFVENFGVSFLPKWDKYNRKAGRIKYI
jgi:hypothetical protein